MTFGKCANIGNIARSMAHRKASAFWKERVFSRGKSFVISRRSMSLSPGSQVAPARPWKRYIDSTSFRESKKTETPVASE